MHFRNKSQRRILLFEFCLFTALFSALADPFNTLALGRHLTCCPGFTCWLDGNVKCFCCVYYPILCQIIGNNRGISMFKDSSVLRTSRCLCQRMPLVVLRISMHTLLNVSKFLGRIPERMKNHTLNLMSIHSKRQK